MSKYTFPEHQQSLETSVKKLFETRMKTKRLSASLKQSDKFTVISNYSDIILPSLKNFISNNDQHTFLPISTILNHISSYTITDSTSILMECFAKIVIVIISTTLLNTLILSTQIVDLEQQAIKDDSSLSRESYSDIQSKEHSKT